MTNKKSLFTYRRNIGAKLSSMVINGMHICEHKWNANVSREYSRKCPSFTEDIEAGHSKWRSRSRTDETAFSYRSREKIRFCTQYFLQFGGDFCVYFIRFNHLLRLHWYPKMSIFVHYGGFKLSLLLHKVTEDAVTDLGFGWPHLSRKPVHMTWIGLILQKLKFLYTKFDGLDQTAHMRSLIWANAFRIFKKIHYILLRKDNGII